MGEDPRYEGSDWDDLSGEGKEDFMREAYEENARSLARAYDAEGKKNSERPRDEQPEEGLEVQSNPQPTVQVMCDQAPAEMNQHRKETNAGKLAEEAAARKGEKKVSAEPDNVVLANVERHSGKGSVMNQSRKEARADKLPE